MSAFATGQQVVRRAGIQNDVVIDGKVVKPTYNAGVRERLVHVTEIRLNENGDTRCSSFSDGYRGESSFCAGFLPFFFTTSPPINPHAYYIGPKT